MLLSTGYALLHAKWEINGEINGDNEPHALLEYTVYSLT